MDGESGKPVSGAVIRIDSSFQFSISDAAGHFTVVGQKGDSVPAVVTHISYNPERVMLYPGKENTIPLSFRAYLAEEVNITATRATTSSAVAYSELEKEEIEKYNLGKDIPFLLDQMPSAVVTSDAGSGVGYTGLRIRGSDATRINVTINGIPVNDAESHQVYWVDLPDFASSIESIQVQRGIGNSTNGAGAFGGSINILTDKLSVKPFLHLASAAGSFRTFRNTLQFGSGIFAKSFAIEGRLSRINSDGYIDRASSDLRSFFLSGGYYGSKSSLRAIAFSGKEKTYQSWYGVPEDSLRTNRTYNPAGEYMDSQGNLKYYDNQTDNYRQDYYQLLYSHTFNSSLNGNIALHYTRGKGYYEEYKPNSDPESYGLTRSAAADSATTASDLIRQLWLSNDFYGFTASVNYEREKIKITAGLAANHYAGRHFGKVVSSTLPVAQSLPFTYYSDNASKSDANIYARGEYTAYKMIKFFLDLQGRRIEYTFDGFDDAYLSSLRTERMYFFNPKAGFSVSLTNEIVFYSSTSIGHKEPVRDDFVYSTPSNRPKPESMTDYETGVRYHSDKVQVLFNSYLMNYRRQLILSGRINDVGEYVRESVKNSYRSGIEWEAKFRFSRIVNMQMNFALSDNRIKSYTAYVDDYDGGPQVEQVYKNTHIAFSPSLVGGAVVGFSVFRNLDLDLSGKYVGKQYLDNTSSESRKLDPYFVSDVHFSYRPVIEKVKRAAFTLSLYNVLDARYSSNGYTYSGYIGGLRSDYNFYYPQAGIHWMAGVSVGF
jgi:iron complex outermembrane receptor protein